MPEPLVVRLSDHPADTYIVPCSCTHQFSDHARGGNRCTAPDSYGCRCECPSYEPDPNGSMRDVIFEVPDSTVRKLR
jgi:hypothetical protein